MGPMTEHNTSPTTFWQWFRTTYKHLAYPITMVLIAAVLYAVALVAISLAGVPLGILPLAVFVMAVLLAGGAIINFRRGYERATGKRPAPRSAGGPGSSDGDTSSSTLFILGAGTQGHSVGHHSGGHQSDHGGYGDFGGGDPGGGDGGGGGGGD